VQPGTFCRAQVVSATDYDLLAEAEPSDPASANVKPRRKANSDGKDVRRRRGIVSLRTVP
jgi:hypothetical protein